jgi:ABC-type phosphate transport system substrate-binding protein
MRSVRRIIVMKTGPIKALIFLITLFMPPALSFAGEVVIIANQDVPVMHLYREDIKEIFMGKKINWENSEKITFVIQDRTDTSDKFLKTYLRKNAYDYDVFWKKQVFTGKGQAPRSFSSEQDLARFVAQTPGAIGYVSLDIDMDAVKIIPVQE